MQDKTIDNALLALWKQNGPEIECVERIMKARGIPIPTRRYSQMLTRGKCKRIALSVLENGPCGSRDVADAILEVLPDIGRKSAWQRAYMALTRLVSTGKIVGEKDSTGRWVWWLAP
ncbi:MAG TPA: hypothetical protein DEO85_05085 [Maritimibacter sp.]|nr:hypothetical protein [Maritimibacter sp.]